MKLYHIKDLLLVVLLLVLRVDFSTAWQKRASVYNNNDKSYRPTPRDTLAHSNNIVLDLRGGGWLFLPAGWNPFGYKVTALGEEFLKFEGSTDGDVGRFLASVRKQRKTKATLKQNWVEVVRVAKTAQAMRILRQLDDLIAFCLKAGFLD
uniref:Uncharacterized protein n=1 Tax=Amphora coffeiformis TaxID=265554 RepID=A0A7S3L3X2_9STRA|eukprot:scaffold7667_cov161-Amphora_coffeaeformis.AAC.2